MAHEDRAKIWTWVTLFIGSIILILWVVYRFSTGPLHYDLFGQQLLSRQWIEGNFEGATIGATNYVLKMIFIYIPSEFVGADPRLFLIISTIIVNILTFVGMYVVLKRILNYFSIEAGSYFNISMLWLAGGAGSIFWIQFTNSRNLEILAGLLLLYLGLLLYKNISLRRGILFVLLAGVTYFSDPMQLYVTSAILVGYVTLHSFFFEKERRKEPLYIFLCVAGGYAVYRLLLLGVHEATGINFISVKTDVQLFEVLGGIPTVAYESMKNTVILVAGTNEMGPWRQTLNLILIVVLAVLSLYTLIKDKIYGQYHSLVLFISLAFAVPVAVFIASGQALFTNDTSRYLIMLAPALIIMFSINDLNKATVGAKKVFMGFILLILAVGIGELAYGVFLSKDKGIVAASQHESRYNYLRENNYLVGYASMDTTFPSMYIFGRNREEVLLPLACVDGVLVKSNLFFDKNVFTKNEKQDGKVPIILDGSAIYNHPSVCSADVIVAQLGEPLEIHNNNSDNILIYPAATLRNLELW